MVSFRSLGQVLALALLGTAAVLPATAFAAAPTVNMDTANKTPSQSIENILNDLTHNVVNYLDHGDSQAMTNVTRDVSAVSSMIDQMKKDSNADKKPQFALITDRWQEFCQMTIKLLVSSELHAQDQTQLTKFQEQARSSIVALALNQKPTGAQQPPSLILLDKMGAQQDKIQSSERTRLANFNDFFKAREEVTLLLQQQEQISAVLPATAPAPASAPAPSSVMPVPGPMGLGLLILLGLAIASSLAAAEITRRRMVKPVQEMLRASEAAAAGDLSCQIDVEPHTDLGHLGTSINRLISVLARSENLVYQLSTLVDSSSEAIISQNNDGAIVSWNKGAQRIYGYSAEEMKGKSITVLTPRQGSETLEAILDAVKRGEKVQPVEMVHEGRNGRNARVFLRVAPIFDSTRQVIGASFWAQELSSAPNAPQAERANPASHSVDQAA